VKVWKVIFAVLIIYAAGAVTGALTVRWHSPPPTPARQFNGDAPPLRWWAQQRGDYLKRLDRDLNLTPDQHQHIEGILRESQQNMRELWDSVAPRAHQEFRHTRERILSELTPEQKKKFETIAKSHGQRKTNSGGRLPQRREGLKPAEPPQTNSLR